MADPSGSEIAKTLKTLFQTEGPEADGTYFEVPSFQSSPGGRLDAFKEISERFSPVTKADPKKSGIYKGIIDDINSRTAGADGLGIFLDDPFKSSELEFAKREIIKSAGLDDLANSSMYPSGSKGMSLTKKKILEDQASRIEDMPNNSSVFDESGLDQIAATLAEAQQPILDGSASSGIEAAGEGLKASLLDNSTSKGPDDGFRGGEPKVLGSQENLDDGFSAAWQDAQSILGIDASPKESESKKDSLERYKKEFSEATGIDVSGKVDKGRALMSFGLALMQNKAGKDFNVSKILKETAVAGEEALPALDKATANAKAGQLAAGQYALGQQKADVAAERAAISSSAKFKNDLYLKFYDSSLKREENLLESKLTIQEQMAEAKAAGKDFTKVDGRTYAVGQGSAASWEVKYVYDSTDPNGGFLLKPENAIKKHIQGREGVTDARELITGLKGAAAEIAEGGGSKAFVYDKLLSFGKAVMPANYLTGQPTNVEDYDKGVKSILAEFKRFLTQETGNGISDKDVEMWTKDLMGNQTIFSNLDATNLALDKLDRIFYKKEKEFDGALEELLDPTNHEKSTRAEILKKFGTYDDLKGQGDLVFVDGKIQRIKK